MFPFHYTHFYKCVCLLNVFGVVVNNDNMRKRTDEGTNENESNKMKPINSFQFVSIRFNSIQFNSTKFNSIQFIHSQFLSHSLQCSVVLAVETLAIV